VPAVFGELDDEFVANLFGELFLLFEGELLDVGRVIHHVQIPARGLIHYP
jgi:hypothetical protein